MAKDPLAALLAIGVNPLDAQTALSRVLDVMPEGADPASWLPTADHVSGPLDKAALMDARAVWYERVETKFKRVLDARRAYD